MPKSKLANASSKHPEPFKTTEGNNSDSDFRYSIKRVVTQQQMDEAVRSGMICLENWVVEPQHSEAKTA